MVKWWQLTMSHLNFFFAWQKETQTERQKIPDIRLYYVPLVKMNTKKWIHFQLNVVLEVTIECNTATLLRQSSCVSCRLELSFPKIYKMMWLPARANPDIIKKHPMISDFLLNNCQLIFIFPMRLFRSDTCYYKNIIITVTF